MHRLISTKCCETKPSKAKRIGGAKKPAKAGIQGPTKAVYSSMGLRRLLVFEKKDLPACQALK